MDYLKSLWQGRMPLFHTYWIIYFLVALPLLYLPQRLLASPEAKPEAGMDVSNLTLVLVPLTAAYMVFASVAVWRSAENYDGSARWANAAKGAVVLGALKFFSELSLPV